MMLRAGGEWLTFALDREATLLQRSFGFGQPHTVLREMQDSLARHGKYDDVGAVLLAAPSLSREDVLRVLGDAVTLKLPPHMASLLQPEERAWALSVAARDTRPFMSLSR